MNANICELVGCQAQQYQNYKACGKSHGKILDAIEECRKDWKHQLEFYNNTGKFYELTNFYENWRKKKTVHVPVHYKGHNYKTSEHAFQGAKFDTKETRKIVHQIIQAPTARDAFDIAQANSNHIRPDWHQMKDQVMYDIVKAKFSDKHLKKVLLKTGDRYLIEASPYDAYWGWGQNHQGENKLGKILMRVRYELTH